MNEAAIDVIRIEIAKLDVEPGDVVLVKVPANWPYERVQNCGFAFDACLKDRGARALVGTNDIEVQIIRKGST